MLAALDALGDMRIGPEKDGKYLPLDPYEAYANGAAKDIDILQGCNKDEMNYFILAAGGTEPLVEYMNNRMAKNFAVLADDEKVRPNLVYRAAVQNVGEPDKSRRKILHLLLHG